MPFKELQNNQSKVKYFNTFSNILIYLFRLYQHLNDVLINSEEETPIIPKKIINLLNEIFNIFNINSENNSYDFTSNELNNEAKNILFQIEKYIIEIFYHLLSQKLMQNSLEKSSVFNSLIMTYIAIYSFNKNTQEFKSPDLIMNLFSQIIYNSRLIILGYIELLSLLDKQNPDKNFNLYKKADELIINNLYNNSNNYFAQICQLRPYLKAVMINQTAKISIININSNELKYKDISFNINEFKELYNIFILNASNILFNNLLFINPENIPQDINLNDLKEDFSNNNINFSFLDLNPQFNKYKNYLIQRLFNSNDLLFKELINSKNKNKDIVFKENNINNWLQKREDFLKYILLLIHMFSGPPARGTEISDLYLINSGIKSLRNIYYFKKSESFILILYYNKGNSIRGVNKNNIRILSKETSYLLLLYIIFIHPLYEYIMIEFKKEKEITQYNNIFNNITSEILSKYIKIETTKYLESPLNISAFRHILIYLIRNNINNNYIKEDEEEEEQIEDILANHTTSVANRVYARDQFTITNGKADLLNKIYLFMNQFFKFLNINNNININININIEKSVTLHNRNKSETINPRPTKRANINKEKNIIQNKNINKNNSMDLFDINIPSPPINILNELRNLFNNQDLIFRPNQEEVLNNINNNINNIIYISGTGSGKTIIPLLSPKIHPNKIIFYGLPLRALIINIQNKLKELNQPFNLLEEDYNNLNSNLILFSYDSIEKEIFINYINKLISLKIDFIFIFDEFHLIITQRNFRYIMKSINKINKYKKQMIFLTATYPLIIEYLFKKEFNIHNYLSSNYKLIRNPILRDNIAYKCIKIADKESENQFLFNYILNIQKNGFIQPQEKIIIFINNILKLKNTQEEYIKFINKNNINNNSLIFHAKLPEAEKIDIINKYQNNINYQILFATEAIGVGVDILNIKYSFHLYQLFDYINYIQQSGRAGRNNQPAESIIIYKDNYYKYNFNFNYNSNNLNYDYNKLYNNHLMDPNQKIEEWNKYKIIDFIYKENQCRRILLAEDFDLNFNLIQCSNNQEKCDYCEKKERLFNIQKNNQVEKERKNNLNLIKLDERFKELLNICPICLLQEKWDHIFHNINNCPYNFTNTDLIKSDIHKIKDIIKENKLLKIGSCCFKCFLPQSLCEENNDLYSDKLCQYNHILSWIYALLILNYKEYILLPSLKEIWGEEYYNIKTIKYILNKIDFYNTDAIYIMHSFLEFNIQDIIINKSLIINPEMNSPNQEEEEEEEEENIQKNQEIEIEEENLLNINNSPLIFNNSIQQNPNMEIEEENILNINSSPKIFNNSPIQYIDLIESDKSGK
jgi:superfamily II DNA helicase RecQ